ncbi:symmetrical bis(5'-nucleosyl)-tetraphosphatase [Reinekea blandensis]|uniref:bis(5'-nucleosyl)-tetraphosphatase (symmetrical) n=1 Tax=Reinekea blandensis MED297 TaxID=314283 RepID=A4BAI9_9GAMM|nr:symmetrical bis(5'-nucleosyl)-tetraphosphatase [Reinekea blandensis]EAR10945.1 bis(5'-nucleosyl)-tetraphosphatase (symmetrical) [Reinekea sp. MED297] [Reinekea blandensis MED297]
MTLYAVGDLQGCLEPLQILLKKVRFDPDQDHLWLAGDLINRGPDSIGCLRFVRDLGDAATTVLGNHDLHALAIHDLGLKTKDADIRQLLSYPDADDLFDWLARQPLLVRDKERHLIMTHAGLPPVWSDKQARKLADEVHAALADKATRRAFFKAMYGNEPKTWHDDLTGHDRLRYIVNAFTRMRFCEQDGTLDFKFKSSVTNHPPGMRPWFDWPVKRKHRIIFGHWAALMGKTDWEEVIGLDTGYVWGNHLTLMDMDRNLRYTCDTDGKVRKIPHREFTHARRRPI